MCTQAQTKLLGPTTDGSDLGGTTLKYQSHYYLGYFRNFPPEGKAGLLTLHGNLQNRVNAYEAQIFWLALVLCPIMWSILFLIALFGFKFKWLLLVCIALVLNGANLYGYIKCKVGHGEKVSSSITNMTSNFFRKQLIDNESMFTLKLPF
ncbi:unnamed protein product [Timema podura]|uniref:Golgi apparatus membrane protein TVP23 homolog n=1 Tax=Timema podura TaxID=61482 RepID=A0ABN7NPP8_TIMPD|nr:unnamed protein product [Timema podura]